MLGVKRKASDMAEYHIDCGNSTDGPVGLCAVVVAASKQEALRQLRVGLMADVNVKACVGTGILYATVYVSAENISIKEVSEVSDE